MSPEYYDKTRGWVDMKPFLEVGMPLLEAKLRSAGR